MYFPVSEIECSPFLPFFIALGVSFVCSMGGISGGFLLLPFQISVLGVTTPSVSATNHLFNLVACPAGVIRFWREGRLIWPLSIVVSLGTLPGVFVGCYIRTSYFQNIAHFRIFVGLVLLYIGLRMLYSMWKKRHTSGKEKSPEKQKKENFRCDIVSWNMHEIRVSFQEVLYTVRVFPVFCLSLFIGVIGGIYGIGGGAIMSPILISIFGLPVYIIAGSTLLSTFVASIGGVLSYVYLSFASQVHVGPDWMLGGLLGLGGIIGMYFGAKCQRYVPNRILQMMLTAILLFIALRYLAMSLR